VTSVDLRGFVAETLVDLGANVSHGDSLLWVQAPESIRASLDVPATFALAFDPSHAGEFGAELVAPGSYFLERLLSAAANRGRWDSVRIEPEDDWLWSVLSDQGFGRSTEPGLEVVEVRAERYFLFTFRLTFLSDEKRESFHALVVSPTDGLSWPIGLEAVDRPVGPLSPFVDPPDVVRPYEMAQATLREITKDEVQKFRGRSLRLLEEEVRRIFGFYDRTVEEIRDANPTNVEELTRAVDAERDRRLAEALERFEPRATAVLCAVRAVLAPTASLRWSTFENGRTIRVDAWTNRIRGLDCDMCHGTEGPWSVATGHVTCARCAVTEDESARPRVRPRSDTPRRGRRASGAPARSPRGSRARSRAASRPRRGP